MPRTLKILGGAKADYRRSKSYIVTDFGKNVWSGINKDFEKAARQICQDPEIGDHIEELATFGASKVRK